MVGDRFSSSTSCSGWLHETAPARPDPSLSCLFLKVATHPAGDLHQDAPAEFLAAHGESTALGIGQAKRPRAQVLPEDPILLPEIRDQIVLVAVHPASERENEEL